MSKLKKLTLKKEVIAKISDDQMNRLKGGAATVVTDWFCPLKSMYFDVCVPEPPRPDTTGILPGGTCYTADYEICRTQ